MRNSTTYFFIFLTLFICIVALNRYHQYVTLKNYTFTVTSACDPTTEKCFAPDANSGLANFENVPYKMVSILAQYAPVCLEEHTCEHFTCNNIPQCAITYCSPDTLADGQSCVTQ